MFSQQARYVLQLSFHLCQLENSRYQTVEEAAEKTGIPAPYLSKIVGLLARKDLVQTKKGPNGGVRLTEGSRELPVRIFLDEIGEFSPKTRTESPETPVQQYEQRFVTQCVKAMKKRVLGDITLNEAVTRLKRRGLKLV